jgi:Ca2+-transporting ATPase
VLFQVFNVFNARAEKGTSFNKRFLDNRMLWLSLAVAIYWGLASVLFGTVPLARLDLGVAFAVASSVLFLEEGRKLAVRLWELAIRRAGESASPKGITTLGHSTTVPTADRPGGKSH